MAYSSSVQRLPDRFASLPWTAQALIVAGAVAAVAVISLTVWQTRRTTWVVLFEDRALRANEVDLMQVAFGRAGLNSFIVEGPQIKVPLHERTAYLKALAENHALPAGLATEPSAAITSPFLSRTQLARLEMDRKKQVIRDMLLQLPFVADAMLEFDETPPAKPFQPPTRSAVVTVQSAEHRPLDDTQVSAVQRIVGSALAMADESILVADVYAYQPLIDAGRRADATGAPPPWLPDLEADLKRALKPFGPLDVRLSATVQCTSSEPVSTPDGWSSPIGVSSAPSPSEFTWTAGANQPAEVPSEPQRPLPAHLARYSSHKSEAAASGTPLSEQSYLLRIDVELDESEWNAERLPDPAMERAIRTLIEDKLRGYDLPLAEPPALSIAARGGAGVSPSAREKGSLTSWVAGRWKPLTLVLVAGSALVWFGLGRQRRRANGPPADRESAAASTGRLESVP